MTNSLKSFIKIIPYVLFVTIIVVGFFLYKDYGLSWDEPISHMNGQVSLEYVSRGSPELWTYSERYYGTIFEMPFAWAQQAFNIISPQKVFFLRHISTFLFFIVGVFFFYLLCLRRFKSEWLALLGSTFLVLSPRIFADSFYNSKDLPLLVAFILSIYTLSTFLKTPSWKNILLHALTTAVAIAIRAPGVFIVGITAIMMILDSIFIKQIRMIWKKYLALFSGYLVSSIILTIALWPFLWQNPVEHFAEAFSDMSKFSRQLDMQVLYFGDFIKASEIPWHYVPVWILISTPVVYLSLFFFGIWSALRKAVKGVGAFYKNNRTDVAVFGWFLGPLIAVILFNSVLYDGWRHLYFIYPALIYIALIGLEAIYLIIKNKDKEVKYLGSWVLGIIVSMSIISTVIFMVVNHPYQNVYFNFLVGGIEKARKNFDLDYWGLSFREGLEFIASYDDSDTIPIFFAGGSPDNLYILKPDIASRFEIISKDNISEARYVISNYRWQRYSELPLKLEIFSVKVQNESILSVFKIK